MRRCRSGSTKFCSTNAHKNAMLPSSCNPCQGEGADAGTFSIFFATGDNDEQPENVEPYCASSISAVDCTLSLGTPSTRSQSHSARKCPPLLGIQHQHQHYYPLRWDFTSYQPNPSPSSPAAAVSTATLGAAGVAGCGLNSGGDPVLLARRCANCDTTSTPLWRNGPKGPKSLCNACGIRYKKEKRRAASFAVTSPSTSLSSPACTLPTATHLDPFSLLQQQQQRCETGYVYEHPCSYSATRRGVASKSPSQAFVSSMSPRGEDDVMDVAAPPGLPWWFNVPIRPRMVEFSPSLLQDYT